MISISRSRFWEYFQKHPQNLERLMEIIG